MLQLGDSRSSSDLDDDNLPYPTPLPRSSFLTADFNAIEYLSTLHNRHQTLEDLRSELRERSQALSKELLDLVNTNYQDFLDLGTSLQGGEEKIEEVRVGLLGLKRELEGLRRTVTDREKRVRDLLEERRALTEQNLFGKKLLVIAERLGDLESRLMVSTRAKSDSEDEDDWCPSEVDEESDESQSTDTNEAGVLSTRRLRALSRDYSYIRRLISKLDPRHPFLADQEPRIIRVRNTLLLDMGSALKSAMTAGATRNEQTMKILNLYREMDEANEAVQILRGRRP